MTDGRTDRDGRSATLNAAFYGGSHNNDDSVQYDVNVYYLLLFVSITVVHERLIIISHLLD